MEKNDIQNELLLFKEKLIVEYDYNLDRFDRIKELGTFCPSDYEKAIKNYNEFKKKYKRGIIISGTLSGIGLAGLVALLLHVKKPQLK